MKTILFYQNRNPQPQIKTSSWLDIGDITSWHHVYNKLSQHAQSWLRPIVNWMNTENEASSWLVKAETQEETYIKHQSWCNTFKRQIKAWKRGVLQSTREGKLLSSRQVMDGLIAEQANFTPEIASPLFYDMSIKQLAQQYPLYAYALEGTCDHLQKTLRDNPQQALDYFYKNIT